jgi:hypothetical protein
MQQVGTTDKDFSNKSAVLLPLLFNIMLMADLRIEQHQKAVTFLGLRPYRPKKAEEWPAAAIFGVGFGLTNARIVSFLLLRKNEETDPLIARCAPWLL